jgi:hypothetical protein
MLLAAIRLLDSVGANDAFRMAVSASLATLYRRESRLEDARGFAERALTTARRMLPSEAVSDLGCRHSSRGASVVSLDNCRR